MFNIGGSFTDGVSVISASWLNAVAAALNDAADAVGGGDYALLPAHTLRWTAGGGGIDIAAPLHIHDGDVPSGGILDIAGTLDINLAAVENVHGGIVVKSLGYIEIESGGFALVDAGASLTVSGSLFINGASGNRTIYVGTSSGGPGHILVNGAGAGSGSDITVQGGADVILSGSGTTLQVLSGADVSIDGSGSTFTVQNAATLTVAADAGTTKLRSPATEIDHLSTTQQEGLFRKFGDNARTDLRHVTLTGIIGKGSKTFDPSKYDRIRIDEGPQDALGETADWTWTFSAAGGGSPNAEVTIYCEGLTRDHNLVTPFGTFFFTGTGSGDPGSLTIIYDGATWRKESSTGGGFG